MSVLRRLALVISSLFFSTFAAVAAPPANDNFANAEVLTGSTASGTALNAEATREAEDSDLAGFRNVWYRWTAPANLRVTISTEMSSPGGALATRIVVYHGDTRGHLNLLDSDSSSTSTVSFTAVQGGVYHFAAGAYSSSTSGTLTVSLSSVARPATLQGPLAPTTDGPTNDSFANPRTLTGTSASIFAYNSGATREAGERDTGYRTVWYRWTAPANSNVTLTTEGSDHTAMLTVYHGDGLDRLNLVDSDVAQSASVTFPATEGAVYSIAVSSYFSSTYGEVFLLLSAAPRTGTLVGPQHPTTANPVNDFFASAQVLSGTSTAVLGYSSDASREVGERERAGYRTLWYRWTAPSDLKVTASTEGMSFTNALTVYHGSALDKLNEVDYDDATSSSVTFTAAQGSVFYIAVGSYFNGSGFGNVYLALSGVAHNGGLIAPSTPTSANPENDAKDNAVAVNSSGTYVAYTTDATREANEDPSNGNRTVWYKWSTSSRSKFTYSTAGTNYGHRVTVYRQDENGELETLDQKDTSSSNGLTATFTSRSSGDTLYVAVGSTSQSSAGVLLFNCGISNGAESVLGQFSSLLTNGDVNGYIRFSVNAKGKIVGQIVIGATRIALSGKFDASGIFTKVVKGYTITLRIGSGAQTGEILGTIERETEAFNLALNRTAPGQRPPTRPAGDFTVIFQGPAAGDDGAPEGYGFGTLKVKENGQARLIGRLADGVVFTCSGYVSDQGKWPIFATTFAGKGRFNGVLSWAATSTSDIAGTFTWVRPANSKSQFYPLGFTRSIDATGSSYIAERPALDLVQPTLEISEGAVAAPLAFSLPQQTGATVTAPGVKLTFNKANGSFSGTVVVPDVRKPVKVRGVVHQKQNVGGGSFLLENLGGRVELGEP